MQTRPVWVEISLPKLIANYRELVRIAATHLPHNPPEIIAVVKANAYGHSLLHCAPALAQTGENGAGANWLGVTSVEEGVAARALCPKPHILIMSGLFPGEADAVIEHRLTPFVWETYHLDLLESAARAAGLNPHSIPIHLELDTGMSRQGLRPEFLTEFLQRFHPLSALKLEGIATHFSSPEVLDTQDTERQLTHFKAAIAQVAQSGHRPKWVHAGNSATLLRGGHCATLHEIAAQIGAKLMLRPGLSLYGYPPRFTSTDNTNTPPVSPNLSPVLEWKTRVNSIRNIAIGESAGYNLTFQAKRPTRLALLPVGYADGLNRLLSNRGSVLVYGQHAPIYGQHAPIAGRISMDQTILDVTGIPQVAIGDEVTIIGQQGKKSISAYDLADLADTIPYEVLCAIAARVPRLLIDKENIDGEEGAAD